MSRRGSAAVTEGLAARWDVVATDLAGSGCLELDVTDPAACRPVGARRGRAPRRGGLAESGDGAELVRAAVEGPVDGFTVVNGVSANRYRKARHGPPEEGLGYRPSGDAWAG